MPFYSNHTTMRVKTTNSNFLEWKGIYVPFNALLGYIGTATSEEMKWRMKVLSGKTYSFTLEDSKITTKITI